MGWTKYAPRAAAAMSAAAATRTSSTTPTSWVWIPSRTTGVATTRRGNAAVGLLDGARRGRYRAAAHRLAIRVLALPGGGKGHHALDGGDRSCDRHQRLGDDSGGVPHSRRRHRWSDADRLQ